MYSKLFIILYFSFLYANEPIEWGLLDSSNGLMYLEKNLFTGRVYKELDIGKIEGEYLAGVRHGIWQKYNRIGEPLMLGEYDNGRKTGVWKHWYINGNKKLNAKFNDDILNGTYREWYEDGRKAVVAN